MRDNVFGRGSYMRGSRRKRSATAPPRETAALLTPLGAKGRKLTFVQTEFWE